MPTSGAAAANLPGADLGWALGVILRSWHQRVEDVVKGLPHGPRGFQILAAVCRATPRSQAALAQHLSIDRTVMPYIIDTLAADGLVVREPDPADRRVHRIVPTERGRTVLAELEARVAAVEHEVLFGLPQRERRTFAERAARAAAAIHNQDPDVDPCFAVRSVVEGGSGR